MRVFQPPDSNALEAADAVRAELDRLSRNFPAVLEYAVLYDATRFVRALGGMLAATTLGLLLIPAFYAAVQGAAERFSGGREGAAPRRAAAARRGS